MSPFLTQKRKDMSELFQQREHWDSCGHCLVNLGCFIFALEDLDVHTPILTLHPLGKKYHHCQDWDVVWSSESKDFKLGDHSGQNSQNNRTNPSFLPSVTISKVRIWKALVNQAKQSADLP